MSENGSPKTLSEKLWDQHLVHEAPGEHDLLYIDMHLVHEVTSPQAFDGLRLAERPVRRPDLTIATADHNVPTIQIERPIEDPISATQLAALDSNCGAFGIRLYPLADPGQGIVHVIGPELGLTLPGMTIVWATVTPRPTAPLVHWPLALVRARWSMCWQRRRCRRFVPSRWP